MEPRSQPTDRRFVPGFPGRFLQWAAGADADRRADAASALARVFLHGALDEREQEAVEIALTALLDDPSAAVRRALAEALAGASDAPRRLVRALANDQAEVAAPLLMRSPVLTDAELTDRFAAGEIAAQCAIAMRPGLGAVPATAILDAGAREAVLALVGNTGAPLTHDMLRRIVERFGDDAGVREALLARPGLSADLRAEIALRTAKALAVFSAASGWLEPERAESVARDGCDTALASIAVRCPEAERMALVRTLRLRGALTMSLLLRSLLGGERAFFAAALAELSGVPFARAASFTRNPQGQAFAALARKAALPRHTLPAFRAALIALDTERPVRREGLKAHLIEATIEACEARRDPALAAILALLGRFAAEAARTQARAVARPARTLPPSLEFSPAANDSGATLWFTVATEPTAPDADPPVASSSDLAAA